MRNAVGLAHTAASRGGLGAPPARHRGLAEVGEGGPTGVTYPLAGLPARLRSGSPSDREASVTTGRNGRTATSGGGAGEGGKAEGSGAPGVRRDGACRARGPRASGRAASGFACEEKEERKKKKGAPPGSLRGGASVPGRERSACGGPQRVLRQRGSSRRVGG